MLFRSLRYWPEHTNAVLSGKVVSSQDYGSHTLFVAEITEAKVVNEEEGKRPVQIKLNNHADAALIEGANAVKLSFYSDATC